MLWSWRYWGVVTVSVEVIQYCHKIIMELLPLHLPITVSACAPPPFLKAVQNCGEGCCTLFTPDPVVGSCEDLEASIIPRVCLRTLQNQHTRLCSSRGLHIPRGPHSYEWYTSTSFCLWGKWINFQKIKTLISKPLYFKIDRKHLLCISCLFPPVLEISQLQWEDIFIAHRHLQ